MKNTSIERTEQYIYKANTWSWDILAAKGSNYAKIIKTIGGISRPYHMFATHMIYAGGKGKDVQNAR